MTAKPKTKNQRRIQFFWEPFPTDYAGTETFFATLPQEVTRQEIEKWLGRSYRIKKVIKRPKDGDGVRDDVKEGDVVYVMELVRKVNRTLKDMRVDSRRQTRRGNSGGGGGGTPQNSGIFYRIVDEDKLADEIIATIDKYFHDKEKCEICKVELNLYEFCLLMHEYFNYIKILRKDSQLSYCNYLKNKVFGGKDKVNVRNFNYYVNNDAFTNFKDVIKTANDVSFDFRPELPRPKTENYLLAPFQEIGWNFQKSDYYKELRREVNQANKFNI